MRAINLIPAEERRGAGGVAGRSGGTVYVLLGTLAALVVLAGVWTMSGRQADDRRAELAEVRAQADAAQATADRLASYSRFATVAESRLQTVGQLAGSRFDWSHMLREVGRILPEDISLESMDGSVAAPAPAQAQAAAAPAAGGPTLKIIGCTPNRQQSVARFMARLRQVDGVQEVRLQESVKPDGELTTVERGCQSTKTGAPKFTITVTFGQVPVDPKAIGTVTAQTTTVNAGSQP